MEVASLELCKELFELSGWRETDKVWLLDPRRGDYEISTTEAIDSLKNFQEQQGGMFKIDFDKQTIPAYSLGYLLRKLYEVRNGLVVYHRHSDMEWEAFYAGKPFEYDYKVDIDLNDHWATVAETPEDAACKLSIELFKQGILK